MKINFKNQVFVCGNQNCGELCWKKSPRLHKSPDNCRFGCDIGVNEYDTPSVRNGYFEWSIAEMLFFLGEDEQLGNWIVECDIDTKDFLSWCQKNEIKKIKYIVNEEEV